MTAHAGSIWTPALIAELERPWNVEKLPAGIIAKRLRMTRNQVLGKAHRLALDSRENPVDYEQVRLARLAAAQPQRHGCRFIASDDFLRLQREGQDIYCGKSVVVPGASWCHEHMRIVFVRHTAAHRWFQDTMNNLSPAEMVIYRDLRAKGVPATAALKKAAVA